jgi:hypothetical protein
MTVSILKNDITVMAPLILGSTSFLAGSSFGILQIGQSIQRILPFHPNAKTQR